MLSVSPDQSISSFYVPLEDYLESRSFMFRPFTPFDQMSSRNDGDV